MRRCTCIFLTMLLVGTIIMKCQAEGDELSYWYSENNMVAYWSNIPVASCFNVGNDSSFTIYSYWGHARSIWSDEGKPTIYSSYESGSNIVCYGGTRSEIHDATGATIPTTNVGQCNGSSNHMYYMTYQNSTKDIRIQSSVQSVYIVNEGTGYNYYNITAHELGHALGWVNGHSIYSGAAIMKANISSYSSTLALTFSDAIQLNQIY